MAIFRANYPMFLHGSSAEFRQSVETRLRHGRVDRRWVAEVNSAVVGCAALTEAPTVDRVFY
ncbi:MAG TPA: hypothetical protein VG815_08465, partial [Chloroflexota bacterium]|nr:hypothetical protein [Chloroflexota bacterium]